MQSPDRRLKRLQGVLLAAVLCLVTAMPCLGQSAAGKSQLIWFAPRDQGPAGCNCAQAIDYMGLFDANAPWTQAASHVQIFSLDGAKFLPPYPPNALTDDQLRQVFADLKRRHILLSVETGILTGPADSSCGNVEGFHGESSLALATRIKELGGTLDYFKMDGPYSHGHASCNWTPQQAAKNAVQNIASIKTIFPNVKVGDIEDDFVRPGSLTQIAAWLDAWRAAGGEPLAFLHADDSSAPIPALDALRQVVEQHQIPFGIIYDGLPSDQSDRDWVNHARGQYESIETAGNFIPDHAVFQSWYSYPKHVLPESDPTTFTHLINTYFRTRTGISAALSAGKVSGKLVDDHLNPVVGAPITVTAEPASGPGLISTYTLTGTVPTGIRAALIQVCVNECGQVGTTDMSIYSFIYGDSDNQKRLDFANGLGDWSLEPTGSASVRAISDVNGNAMHISATANQRTSVNSALLTITPGSSYVLTVRARIAPSSVGSGSFRLVFLAGGIGTSVAALDFTPAKVVTGAMQTNGDGTYGLPYAPPSADQFKIQAEFPGDDVRWPAIAVVGGGFPATSNFEGLWWASPAGSESGWGINFAHQGDVIFATWFTYDASGKAWWLTMTAERTGSITYAGKLYETRGPAFNAVPFDPARVQTIEVGNGALTFTDANNGTFSYTANGITQTKRLVRQAFGPLPVCTWGTQWNLAFATNYQDLWWAAPAGVESGWGVNLTHQGDTIFATWFTYDFDGTPMWLVVTALKTAPGVYTGDLYRTTGPAFSAVPWDKNNVALIPVGTLTITFADGNNASYAYTVNFPGQSSVTQTKTVTRQVFRAPGTVCQ